MSTSTLDSKHVRTAAALAGAVAWLLAGAAPAAAQTFPPDDEWVPLPCVGGVMTDLYQDESGALGARDIVGDEAAPAGFRAVDDEFLYLRLRLDEDPAPGGSLRPFGWGLEVDTDGDVTTYEVLIIADGVGSAVTVHANTTTTLPNDPNDPADEPPVASNPFSSHGRSVVAVGSSYGNGDDYFLDLAAAWTDLTPIGLEPDTPVVVWAASSSNVNSLNGDFACHDGSGADPDLSDTASDPTELDPDTDSDGDGFTDADENEAGTDPYDPNSCPDPAQCPTGTGNSVFEGGGGCATAGGDTGPLAAALLLLLALALPRRRRGQRAASHSSAAARR